MVRRRQTVEVFRERLGEVIDQSGSSRAAFAREAGIDRSTLSQILNESHQRLPRVETLAAIATSAQVSIDWLVGLSEEGPLKTDILHQTLEIRPGGLSPTDQTVQQWQAEAAGYKIRYVPATLPDLVKIDALLEYEYSQSPATTPDQRRETKEAGLEYQRRPETDTEVCSSFQSLTSLARGEGIWSGLDGGVRREQLQEIASLTKELYPTFRWFLYDGLQRFSVPLTIFGPKRAAVYMGQKYFVLNSREHIQALIVHFDDLIRAAVVQPPDVPAYLGDLVREL